MKIIAVLLVNGIWKATIFALLPEPGLWKAQPINAVAVEHARQAAARFFQIISGAWCGDDKSGVATG